jgi:hypothetical protein
MASIKMVPEEEATGKVKEVYEDIRCRLGRNDFFHYLAPSYLYKLTHDAKGNFLRGLGIDV